MTTTMSIKIMKRTTMHPFRFQVKVTNTVTRNHQMQMAKDLDLTVTWIHLEKQ